MARRQRKWRWRWASSQGICEECIKVIIKGLWEDGDETRLYQIIISLTAAVQPEYSGFKSKVPTHDQCCLHFVFWSVAPPSTDPPIPKLVASPRLGCQFPPSCSYGDKCGTLINLKRPRLMIPNNVVTKNKHLLMPEKEGGGWKQRGIWT